MAIWWIPVIYLPTTEYQVTKNSPLLLKAITINYSILSVLAQAPDEEEALQCRVICFLQLSKFQEALQAINKNAKLAK